MSKYRKKPIEVEAMQWRGDNEPELARWSHGAFYLNADGAPHLYVAANHASLRLMSGEWVIHDSKGYYPCQADVFEATYEPVPA